MATPATKHREVAFAIVFGLAVGVVFAASADVEKSPDRFAALSLAGLQRLIGGERSRLLRCVRLVSVDSTERERRFRRECERHSGPKANGVRSVATLAFRLWSKCSAWSRETCPERSGGRPRARGKGRQLSFPLSNAEAGERQLDGWVPRFLRMESPRISMRCALWTRRSRMPAAAVGSPICSCQRATGSCDVRIVERV